MTISTTLSRWNRSRRNSALLHPLPRIRSGGRHDGDVQADGVGAAQAHHLARLDDPQELRLGLHGHRVDFVEKNRPALRRFELARLAFPPSPGECSGGVPEQLALHELPRQGAAVDGHEGLVRAVALGVDGVGDHLLAGAGFAQDQDGLQAGASSHGARELERNLQRGRAPEDVRKAVPRTRGTRASRLRVRGPRRPHDWPCVPGERTDKHDHRPHRPPVDGHGLDPAEHAFVRARPGS